MATTPVIGFTEITSGDVNGDVTYNANLRMSDWLAHKIIEDLAPVTVPGSPANGQAWIIDTPGNWSNDALGNTPTVNDVAHRYDSAWYYYSPAAGWNIFDNDTLAFYYYSGSAWTAV